MIGDIAKAVVEGEVNVETEETRGEQRLTLSAIRAVRSKMEQSPVPEGFAISSYSACDETKALGGIVKFACHFNYLR